jgi:Acetyltransferases
VERQGEIIGQSWAWRGTKGELVFDSLETLGNRVNRNQWQKVMEAFSARLAQQDGHDVTTVLIGTGGETPALPYTTFKTDTTRATPYDYRGYRDSTSGQYLVKKIDPPQRQSTLIVRDVKPGDKEALLTIENHTFDETRYRDFIFDAEDFDHFMDNPDGDVVLVAERDGQICGYVAVEFYPDDPGVPQGSANIYSMAVVPDNTGKTLGRFRIAKALLEGAEEIVRKKDDHDAIHLETHEANRTVIQSLTRHRGYEIFGRYHKYFSDGKDAIRLRKYLRPSPSCPRPRRRVKPAGPGL